MSSFIRYCCDQVNGFTGIGLIILLVTVLAGSLWGFFCLVAAIAYSPVIGIIALFAPFIAIIVYAYHKRDKK